MKIAYFGLPLGALLLAQDGHELGPVVLAPVDAPGRRRTRRFGGAVIDALNSKPGARFDKQIQDALSEHAADVLLSWFWTRKLPAPWLEATPRGAFGVHPSLLPRHRGPNPYFWAIDAGDLVTGVTVHRLSEEYDTGALCGSQALEIADRDAWQLARALDRPSLALLREAARRLARGELLPEAAQDDSLATWAPEPTGDALRLDFGWTTERVLRRIRALSPTPGLALEIEGVPLFVTRAEPAEVKVGSHLAALLAGEAHIGSSLFLRTGDGAVRVLGAFFPDTDVTLLDPEAVAGLVTEVAAGLRSRGVRP